ncbi:nuclear pore complex protein Nup133 [Helicoverpa zea]|uniref:nuclear pore complex protein Nup133 n=1 Tax=Helicoverpa zea TaxID=7113 RepID=UPI001F5AFF2A|nr:nuclear pore complex protein Nup133 [Helicoverpa zea]
MDYSSTGAMRSPFSPRVRQSVTGRRPIGLSSAKKNQSKFMQPTGEPAGDVVYKTPLTTIETYGMPLPVMVTEALTFASGEVSVRLSACGWCWIVSGRRIISWPRTSTTSSNTSLAPASTIARELSLPQTDLAHKADLVVLFYMEGAQMPSCIGVSPEGTVRYWPSVGQEGVYTDVSCELAGQECEKLGDYTPEGLVLATTTCTVVLLNPTVVEGRATVTCRTLRPPSGWLGGIGRRVSLLFFGSMPAHADTKLVGVVVLPGGGDAESTIALVSGGPALQLWRGAELHEHALRRPLTDAVARTHLASHGDLNSLEIMALDVQPSGNNGLLLLIATVNVARSPEMRYAIAHVSVEDVSAPRVSWLVQARGWAGDADEPPRFLPLPRHALLYTRNYIAILSTTVSNDKVEYIDVSGEGDAVLGAALCGPTPLLFSRKHGVLALAQPPQAQPTPSMCESPLGSPCPSDMYDGNLSLYEIDPHEVSLVTQDACGKLKTAFLFHVRRETAACRAALAELFPAGDERDVDAPLDRAARRIAAALLDDAPAGDPRWRRRGPATDICLGSSAALQLDRQLRDKQRAFSLFCDFLRAVGLWQRLGLVTNESGGGVVSTESALGGLAEQLATAITLRKLQQGPDAQLIDAAIYQVVCGSRAELEEEPEVEEALASGALAPADVCYRRVSRVCRVLRALRVLAALLRARHAARAHWPPAPPALGSRTLLSCLSEFHTRAVTQAAHDCPEPALRAQVYETAADLADLILADAELLNASSHTQHLYERIRRDTIQPYVDEGQRERAAALAEKFKDFELLIEMCVDSDDIDKLFAYIDKYSNEGIAEITFARLAEGGGGRSALLLRRVGARLAAPLRAWLQAAPARTALLALHLLSTQHLAGAADALLVLANEEVDSVNRLTTTASLAKLCLQADAAGGGAESGAWRRLESRLALAAQHRALPRPLRLHHGLDAGDSPVLPPDQLVQMYIESESSGLTEYDYKKALDLTDYVHDMERRDDLRLRVWCACIRRDDWSSCRVDSPADELHTKMFFRLIDLVHVMGGDLELLLPPVEDILTAPELAELVSDPRFHFIIKYGYECVDTTRNHDMTDE